VISSSPGELEPVFETILEWAMHLCDAKFGALFLREGNAFRTVVLALVGIDPPCAHGKGLAELN